MFEDLAFGAVPILGDVTSILMNYDFVRRVDITARRVFQERWLKDRGKVDEIFPAPESRRRSSLQGGLGLFAQLCYAGIYGIAFGATFPLALAAGDCRRLRPGLPADGFLPGSAPAGIARPRRRPDWSQAGVSRGRPGGLIRHREQARFRHRSVPTRKGLLHVAVSTLKSALAGAGGWIQETYCSPARRSASGSRRSRTPSPSSVSGRVPSRPAPPGGAPVRPLTAIKDYRVINGHRHSI